MKRYLPALRKSNGLLFTIIFYVSFSNVLLAQSEEYVIYSQHSAPYSQITSYRDYDDGGAVAQSADDFEIPGGQTWIITRVIAPGISVPPIPEPTPFGGEVLIYSDDSGKPGELIYISELIPPGQSNGDMELVLTQPVTLESGIYWLSLYGQSFRYFPEEKWYWKTTDSVSGNPAYLRNTVGRAMNITQGDWAPLYKAIPQPPVDLLFTLYGVSTGDAAPAAPRDLNVMYAAPGFNLTWSDRSNNESGFVIERGMDGEVFAPVATVGPDEIFYHDNDTFDNTKRYHYRIAALDSAGNNISNFSYVAFADVVDTLYSQPDEGGNGFSLSQEFDNILHITLSADDFSVPEGKIWNLKKVFADGSSNLSTHIKNAYVKIFADSSGLPTKNELYTAIIILPYEDRSKDDLLLTLPEIISIPEGRYWFSTYVEFYMHPTTEQEYWYWNGTDSVNETSAHIWDYHPSLDPTWLPAFDGAPEGPYDLVFTLFGIETPASFDSTTLESPVAKLPSFVTPTSFNANWEAVEGADHYELNVMSIKDSVYYPGYEAKVVYGTSQLVAGPKRHKRYAYVVRAVNEFDVSDYSNAIPVASIKDLTLRTVCSDTPSVYRRWKVINNNPFPIDVTWNVLNTTQSGTHVATIGESFFITETVSGLNKTMIAWYDDEQVQHISVKSSTYKPCEQDSANALARTAAEDEWEETDSPFMVATYPNPVTDKFEIMIASPLDGMVNIEILNINGQRVYMKKTMSNTIQNIDATSFPKGMFILKATQKPHHHSIKIMKY